MDDNCRHCEYLRITPGDLQPYGDTYYRESDEWECRREEQGLNCILVEEGLEDGE